MNLKIKNSYLFGGVLLLILGIFFLGWYLGLSKERSSRRDMQSAYENEIERYRIRLGAETLYVAKVQQQLATEKELRIKSEVEKGELSKLGIRQLNELNRLKIRIDTLLEHISHTGQVIVIPAIDSIPKQNCIVLPFGFGKKDEWLDLKGYFDANGELSAMLHMGADISVYAGLEKKTKKPICIVTSNNPYLQTINVSSFKLDQPRKKHFSIGTQVGYGFIMSNPVRFFPYFGVGLQRNIISF